MAPTHLRRRQSPGASVQDDAMLISGNWRDALVRHPEDLVLESWSQGFVVGALIVMACITIANMRRGILLHKLILFELLLAMSHGTFCFMSFKGSGWYLSATASLLYLSWILHNVVAWMKVKPFFSQPGGFFKPTIGVWVRRMYLGTLALTVPAILFQITNNFRFFNNRGGWYTQVRPYEPLMRDPWWTFTCLVLFHVIRKCYGTGVIGLVKRSPRFGILLSAIFLSVAFTVLDIVASIHSFVGATDGINPWWKLSLVFKCLTDTIMLDDFKTELKRLGVKRIEESEKRRSSVALVTDYSPELDGFHHTTWSRSPRNTTPQINSNLVGSPNLSVTFSNGSTCLQNSSPESKDSQDDNDEDSISDYAAHLRRESQSMKNNIDNQFKQQGEIDFITALATKPVGPPDGISSSRRHRHLPKHEDVRTTTRKISHLPSLKRFRFPTAKSEKASHGKKANVDIDDDDHDSIDPGERVRARNLAEEIQRNTIMDLEAQRRTKSAMAEKRLADDVEDDNNDGDKNRTASKDSKNPASDTKAENAERLSRFRTSIGAADTDETFTHVSKKIANTTTNSNSNTNEADQSDENQQDEDSGSPVHLAATYSR